MSEAADDPTFGLPPLPEGDLPESPFLKPLARYTAEEAEMFFGRGYQVRELYERVIDPGGPPIILLYGQSGVGKSSLLDAGLLPRLAAGGYERPLPAAGPAKGPARVLAGRRSVPGGRPTLGAAWHAAEARLERPLVMILDQVEESFTRPTRVGPTNWRNSSRRCGRRFGDRDARPRGKLILGFRKEWLAEITTAREPGCRRRSRSS